MKTDNASLANIVCNGCNGQANIKRKRTGKKLLYLHCTNCGLDQRSGEFLQKKWQHAIDGISEITSEVVTEVDSELSKPTTETISETIAESSEQEWQPTKNNQLSGVDSDSINEQTRPESGSKEQASGGSGAGWLATIIGVGLVIARIRA